MKVNLVRRLLVLAVGATLATGAIAQADKQVKIGILNDQSGPYSGISGPGSVTAAKLAIEDAGGTMFGKPIGLVVGDHTHKPDVGTTMARRWIDTEGVNAIFDIYSSGVSLAVQKVVEEKDRILAVSMASSRDIGGKNCSPNGFQWANDGYAVANLVIRGETRPGSWYFMTVDYAAGLSVEKDSRRVIDATGGTVVGSTKFPLGTTDYSSFMLQAQASKAKKVAFIGGGADMINAIKQSVEFGLEKGGQIFLPTSLTTDDIFSLGNAAVAGMPAILSFYWDETPATQAWTERFKKLSGGKMPTDPQANVYSAVFHYLKAVKAVGTTDTKTVLAKMKSTPVDDFFTHNAKIREDGRVMRDMWFATAKAPSEMKNPTDMLKLVKKFSGEDAFVPVALSECPALKK